MPLIPLQNFGKYGVISDVMSAPLPIGTWNDARNMRFSGNQMEKMLEPLMKYPFDYQALGDPQWMQSWSDGISSYITLATQTDLFFLVAGSAESSGSWVNASKSPGAYSSQGLWDSFAWGDTAVYNNGVDPPQIFNLGTQKFMDLPRWGLISTADDIVDGLPPSKNVAPSCRVLRPYKNFLVAMGITEGGLYQPNTTWWSDSTDLSTYRTDLGEDRGPPSWDYESPETLSGKSEVGVGYGAITCAENLNENHVIYTDNSATLMNFVGGNFVMSFRRLFNKGAAGRHCAVEFNNRHFVLSRDQMYIHDGSSVQLIAKDRVEETFFRKIGKPGRFGGTGEVDWEAMQVVQNADRKEIYIIYNRLVEEAEVVTPDVIARADLLYQSGTPWQGFHTNYGMVVTDNTGQHILINHKGHGALVRSSDFGASFGGTGTPLPSVPDSATFPMSCFRWSPFHNAFICQWPRNSPRQPYWGRISTAGVWTDLGSAGGYSHGFFVDPITGDFYYPNSAALQQEFWLYKNAPTAATYKIKTVNQPTGAIALEWSPGVVYAADEREVPISPAYSFAAPKSMSGASVDYGLTFNNVRRLATSGQGAVVGIRTVTGNIVRVEKLIYTGSPTALETYDIDFGVAVAFADICYSAGLGGYLIAAMDASNNRLLHLRYSAGDNITGWTEVQSVYLHGYVQSNINRQIYHAVGNVHYYCYLQMIGASSNLCVTVEKITFNTAPDVPAPITVLSQLHFDSYVGGVYQSLGIGPNLNAANLPQTTTAKYGPAAMQSNAGNRGQFVGTTTLNPNNMCAEIYYRPTSFPASTNHGLWHFGAFTTTTPSVNIWVSATGQVGFSWFMASGNTPFNFLTDPGVVILNEFNEICCEVDELKYEARIYVGGILRKTSPVARTQWNAGPQNMFLAYSRVGGNDVNPIGQIDEWRLSDGPRYNGENYPAHGAPF